MERTIHYCNICGCPTEWDDNNNTFWLTSSFGVCSKCYNELTEEKKEEIRQEYE